MYNYRGFVYGGQRFVKGVLKKLAALKFIRKIATKKRIFKREFP